MVRMPGSSSSAAALPSGVISIRTLRRSAGLGMRRIELLPAGSSVAVMVAEATRIRSLTWEGVSGVPASSMTASAVATGWEMPKVAAMCRLSPPSSASPVRTRDAYASVQVGVAAGVLVGKVGVDPDDAERGRGGAAAPPRPQRASRLRHP